MGWIVGQHNLYMTKLAKLISLYFFPQSYSLQAKDLGFMNRAQKTQMAVFDPKENNYNY